MLYSTLVIVCVIPKILSNVKQCNDVIDCLPNLRCSGRKCIEDILNTDIMRTPKFNIFPEENPIKYTGYGSACVTSKTCRSNMLCINNICACSEDQYYSGESCSTLSLIGGTCSSVLLCQNYLPCFNGVCDCPSGTYLDTVNKRCLPKLSYSAACNTSLQCQDSLTCLNGICTCTNTQFYYTANAKCSPKLQIGEACSSAVMCQSYLTCFSGVCVCPDGTFADNLNETCLPKLSYSTACNTSLQCQDSLTCLNGICACTNTQFYYTALSKCFPLASHLSNCFNLETKTCDDVDLRCTTERSSTPKCLCSPDMYYNNGGCRPVSDLKVTLNPLILKDARKVNFSWTTDHQGINVTYRITWSARKNNSDRGEQTADRYGGVVTGLAPGREYTFTVQSVLPQTEFYNERSTSVQYVLHTDPSVPGKINNDPGHLDGPGPPYIVRFGPSEGDVAYYKVIMTHDSQTLTFQVDKPEITSNSLDPDTLYVYSIAAYNSLGELSEATVGTFKTGRTVSSTAANDGTFKIDSFNSAASTTETETPIALIIGVTVSTVIVLGALIVLAICLLRRKRLSSKIIKQDKSTKRKEGMQCPAESTNENSSFEKPVTDKHAYEYIDIQNISSYCQLDILPTDEGNVYTALGSQPVKKTNKVEELNKNINTQNSKNAFSYENHILNSECPA